MKSAVKSKLLFFFIILFALALRLPRLAQRPMHTDEAVHAIKFGRLLEQGEYFYDYHEYHGPTLNYFSLIPAIFTSAKKLTEISESSLRIVPVVFGVILILLLRWLVNGLGWPTILFAALFTAISPAMVYYSRYYIQEMLLVCFSLGAIAAGFRYLKSRQVKWVVVSGVFLGLMHATKETAIIAFGAMGLSLLLVLWMQEKTIPGIRDRVKTYPLAHGLILLGSAVLVSMLFYSSFFSNPAGIWDSIKTYLTYFDRAGQNQSHNHPWYYYLQILTYYHVTRGPVWSEIFILLLAIVGAVFVFFRKQLPGQNLHFLGFWVGYTLILTLIYSLIPYKTPWCLTGFLQGMTLLAGTGAVVLLKRASSRFTRGLVIGLLTIGGLHLGWQSWRANDQYAAAPGNPYVYGHTSTDVPEIVRRVEDVAAASAVGKNLHIELIFPGDDYWPFPWYFREFPNVGYWNHVDLDSRAAPLILISPAVEADLMVKLYELPPPGEKNLYLPLFENYVELRPGVEMRIYIEKALWDEYYYQLD